MIIPSLADGHFEYFHSGADVSNTAINIRVQVFVRTRIFSLGDIPRSGIASSYGNSMFNC